MKATVRDYCAGLVWQEDENRRFGVVSIDEMLENAQYGGTQTWERAQMLMKKSSPGPIFEGFERPDVEKLADAVLERMSRRQQVALLVKYIEGTRSGRAHISLEHPTVLLAAQSKRSQMYKAWNSLEELFAQTMMDLFHEDAISAREWLAPVVKIIARKIFLKIKTEKLNKPFLKYVKALDCEMPEE
ncbi:MAG: hypothetical protein EOM20_10750 [Spartobacteria bacterium]|nr:hypothetical protein [Spartobacteria bacterium]